MIALSTAVGTTSPAQFAGVVNKPGLAASHTISAARAVGRDAQASTARAAPAGIFNFVNAFPREEMPRGEREIFIVRGYEGVSKRYRFFGVSGCTPGNFSQHAL